jgi:hypothetical protein
VSILLQTFGNGSDWSYYLKNSVASGVLLVAATGLLAPRSPLRPRGSSPGLKSRASIDAFLTFHERTALRLICFAPTLVFGSLDAT